MRHFFDQTGRTIHLNERPRRIVSLVPSQTELLASLGLDEEVVAITKFCKYPDQWFRNKTRIGGTKTVNIHRIRELQPDLIIANKEENVRAQIGMLAEEFPVWISDVNDIPQALAMIGEIGRMTNRVEKSLEIISTIEMKWKQFSPFVHAPTAAYLIWKEPYMAAGGGTFIHSVMDAIGIRNHFAETERYPEVSTKDLESADLVFLSSEPYPFKQQHADQLQQELPAARILLVDGEAFSWYGSRMMESADYLHELREMVSRKDAK